MIKKPAAIIILSFFLLQPPPLLAEELKKAPVDSDGRFYNPWRSGGERSFLDFLKWQLFSRNPYSGEKKKEVRFRVQQPDFASLNSGGKDWFVWLGHSTVLMKVGGKVIITDPVFWDVNFLVRRKTALPIDPEELPPIDYVLISHGHYDHLNTRSIKFLKDRFDPVFITGPGYERYFSSVGVKRRLALDWSEAHVDGGLKITSLPVQHWSKRFFSEADKMLWCSFLVEVEGRRYYWAGDTGYFSGFQEIGERYGQMDAAFLPIGAYEPRWFMKENHMDPPEALHAAIDLKAKVFVPIHWGTFDLSDEPLWLPVERLAEEYRQSHREGNSPELKLLDHGGSYMP